MSVKGLFASAREIRGYDTGEVIFEQGSPSASMFGVVSGSVQLLRDGEPVVTIPAEGTFGELGIIDQAPRSLTAVAAEPSQIAVIDERTFLFLVEETPKFALQVMQRLAARIRELDGSGTPVDQQETGGSSA